VLAGVNGAGKSSIIGEAIRAAGGEYFNPDEATERLLAANPGAASSDANAAAWNQGRRLLERAIAERLDYAFETTLGGTTITRLLESALDAGLEVHIRYVGLESPELHIARVRARVASGGHDIPESRIRERYEGSRRNLIRLLPRLTDLAVFDNSIDTPPLQGGRPEPKLLLQTANGSVLEIAPLASIPTWAKPIVMAVLGDQALHQTPLPAAPHRRRDRR
jgi:predicted ABC-type ATPase